MISIKLTIFFIVGSIILFIGAVLFLSALQKPDFIPSVFSVSSGIKPVVQTDTPFFDFGNIKVADIQTKDFKIKNVGSAPLQLFAISSSCGCTVGQIKYQGLTSREFGMHAPSELVATLPAGDFAILKVKYRPYFMPVYGAVSREVYVSTNDPARPKLVFQIKAYVE